MSECKELADLLAPLNWQSKKRKDFDVWKEAVELIMEREHLTKSGFLKLLDLREQLNDGGRGRRKFSYSTLREWLEIGLNKPRTRIRWTREEEHLLKQHYPNFSRASLRKALQNRGWKAIRSKARLLGFQRPVSRNSKGQFFVPISEESLLNKVYPSDFLHAILESNSKRRKELG
jgi:hypothetical protein